MLIIRAWNTLHTGAAVFGDLSVRSPRKLIIFIVGKLMFFLGKKYSKIFHLLLNTQSLVNTVVWFEESISCTLLVLAGDFVFKTISHMFGIRGSYK